MTATRRLGLLAGLFLAAWFSTGCDMLALPWVIFGPDPRIPPELKEITNKDKKRDVSVVVLTYAGSESRPEFIRFDRDLADQIVRELKAGFAYNEELVKVVSPSKVDKFKQEHPGWQTLSLVELGKHFNADWVLYVEIDNDTLTLYNRGSGALLYHGHADTTVTIADVRHADDGFERRNFSYNFPNDNNAITATDSNPTLFKQAFLNYVAKRVAWCVTA